MDREDTSTKRVKLLVLLALAATTCLVAGLSIWSWVRTRRPDLFTLSARKEPPIELPKGKVQIKVYQRDSKPIPGSKGNVTIAIADVTRGQVTVTMSYGTEETLIPSTSVQKGDELSFAVKGNRYVLTLKELKNYLIGQDYAVFEVTESVPETASRPGF